MLNVDFCVNFIQTLMAFKSKFSWQVKTKIAFFMDFTRTEFKLILNMNLLLISEHLNLFEKCICLFF